MATSPEKVQEIRNSLKGLTDQRDNLDGALKSLEKSLGEKEAKREAGYKIVLAQRDSLVPQIEALQKRLDSAEQEEKTRGIVQPIIDAFGTLKVPTSASGLNSIHFNDIDVKRKAANELAAKAASQIAILDKLAEAAKAVKVDAETAGSLKNFSIVADGEHAVKIAVATRGASSGTGTRATRGLKVITGAHADYAHLIGKRVGKDGDYASFAAMYEAEFPEDFKKSEASKATGSNYSARVKMARKGFEIVAEDAEPAATEEAATAEAAS